MNISTREVTTLLGMAMLSSVAMAQDDEQSRPMLDRGTKELSIAGTIDIPHLDTLNYDLNASYGYFFKDGWEAGGRVAAADTGGQDRIALSGFTEYNFRRNRTIVPYVGGGLGLVTANFGNGTVELTSPISDQNGLVFNVEGGGKFFLKPYMAITASIDFQFSTEDVFETDEAIEDNLSSIRIGMRYYF